jgi:L-fuconolactonase
MSIERAIDTHVHLINPDRLEYPWMDEAPSLRKTFAIDEFQDATNGLPISEMVFMEVSAAIHLNFEEIEWIESLYTAEPRLKGIIARAAFHGDDREAQLDRMGARKSVVAIRDIIQWEQRGYSNADAYIAGVNSCAKNNLAVDLCIFNEQFDDIIGLARACPNARLILDHLGKPSIKDGIRSPWAEQMKTLSECENVFCKISGLMTEAALKAWSPSDFDFYLNHALESFGIDRLVYGGDWPVCTLSGSYKEWFDICDKFSSSWSDDERDKFYFRNARKFYFQT